ASALTKLHVDHIGVLVGKGEFPREQSIEAAKRIFVGIPPSSKGSALCLSADLSVIELVVVNLRPAILHLGGSANLVRPEHVLQPRRRKSDGSRQRILRKGMRVLIARGVHE